MDILKNYMSTILLLLGVLIGGICGLIFGESASVVKPVGDLFLNLMFVLVVPIVFLSVSSAMYQMKHTNMVGKIMGKTVFWFVVMSVVSAVLTMCCVLIYNPMEGMESQAFEGMMVSVDESPSSWGEILVETLTVPEFLDMFTKAHLLPLIIFSVIFGLATAMCGEKGDAVASFMNSAMQVVLKMMDLLMKVAPVCLGCYFAHTIGSMGAQIAGGLMGSLVLYVIATLVLFFGVNSIYIGVVGGMDGLKTFWRHIITPSLTAVATCSSAACIPVNITAAKAMGMRDTIAETVIPFGINMHKDGSVASAVIKIVFLMCVFGGQTDLWAQIVPIVFISVVTSTVVGAIPNGGLTGELLICSILGFNPSLAGTLLVIAALVDIPATLLNSTNNVVAAVLVDKTTRRIS